MVKKITKPITIGIILTTLLMGIFLMAAGCSSVRYNAVLFDNANRWFHTYFLKNNFVRSAAVFPEEWLLDEEFRELFFYNYDTLPMARTIIIKNTEKFNAVFKEFPLGVDFEKEMLLVYIFGNGFSGTYGLRNLLLYNDILNIELSRPRSGRWGAPHQRCIVIRMDRKNFTEVIFTVGGRLVVE